MSTPSTLTVTITGTNDAPVVVADTAAVQEDLSITATGNVLANDSDVDQGTVLRVANAGVFAGQFGQLILNADGSYTYALDNTSLAVQSLAEGRSSPRPSPIRPPMALASTPSTLTVTITGTNDAPVVVADTAAVQEDISVTATGNVLANDSDVDQGTVLRGQCRRVRRSVRSTHSQRGRQLHLRAGQHLFGCPVAGRRPSGHRDLHLPSDRWHWCLHHPH